MGEAEVPLPSPILDDVLDGHGKTSRPERHYIDLFASAGLARVRDSGEVVESSALIAASVPDAFTCLHLCERDPALALALQNRLDARGAQVRSRVVVGDVNQKIDEVLGAVPSQHALSVAFADPYGLHLDFETVRWQRPPSCDSDRLDGGQHGRATELGEILHGQSRLNPGPVHGRAWMA
ncbi:MAG: three-Cys-motif partner protein TcmP [Phycisphaerales bacterium]|nr:three-Cys-motif partner protein TcmP [Phycisphaerales bacterium]